jgi:hypothetical protein
MSATNTVPHPILDRMGYTNPSVVRDWKKIFSQKPPKKAADKPAAKTTTNPVKKARGKKDEAKPETASLILNRNENPTNFDRVAFVFKARSTNTNRKFLTVLHVEQIKTGSRLVATDGMRLHVAEINQKIKSGDYKPIVTKDRISLGEPVEGIVFPNWANVIPGTTRKRGTIDLADTGVGKDRNQTERLTWAFNSFVNQTGELINLRYLEDLTKKKWTIYSQNEKHKAIVLKEAGAETSVFAVIMPLAETNTTENAA